MSSEIVQKENKVLRHIAKPVAIEDIKSRKIDTIIRRMIKALDNEEDGVAIAAPQIGESLRIFVVSKKIFEIMEDEKMRRAVAKSKKDASADSTSSPQASSGQGILGQIKEPKDMVFINPEILKMSKKKMMMEEGCLSVRWLYGKVERKDKALVKAYDEHGKPFTLGGTGLLAQVFQHEIDHLDGVLFIDKAIGLKEMPPEKK